MPACADAEAARIQAMRPRHPPLALPRQCALALLLMPCCVSLKAAAEVLPSSALSHKLDTVKLTLDNQKKRCQLHINNPSTDQQKTIPLLMTTPCYWVVGGDQKTLLSFSYESVNADKTLLVAGTTLHWSAEKRSYQKLPAEAFCSQYLQGVIISGNEVFAVDEKMVAAHCETGLAMDEKIFYSMAHNPRRYQKKGSEAAAQTAKPETADAVKKDPIDQPEGTEEKSFIDSVTESVKEFFSGEDAKE